MKQLSPPFGFYKHDIGKTEVLPGGTEWLSNHNQRGLFMILNILYLVLLNARQRSARDILNNGHFVSICSHRRNRSLPSARSACRDLFAVWSSFSCGHLLMGSPWGWLYGTRKWSERAFNYFIVNAGCQEGKDMIGFDYQDTAAEKNVCL